MKRTQLKQYLAAALFVGATAAVAQTVQPVCTIDVSRPGAEVAAIDSIFKHPVLDCWRDPGKSSDPKRLEPLAQEILGLTETQLLAVIPEQTPRIHIQCPVCAHKAKTKLLPQEVAPFSGIFDPLHPDQIQCKDCKALFPNADYPMDKIATFRNMLGEDVSVAYWEDVDGPRTLQEKLANRPHRLYMRGIIDTARKLWLLPRLDALAKLYHHTHDERYARPLILVLDELAKRYPHYLLVGDYGHTYVSTRGQKPPYGFVDTRWGRRSGEDLPGELLRYFDVVASSPLMNSTTKERIIAGLFLDPQKRLDLWTAVGGPDMLFGNETPLKDMVERALVLESPERVHACYHLIRQVPRHATTCDGIFRESLGYGSLFRLTFFMGARLLDGYSDPPGFVGSDGLHLENIHPMQEMEKFYQRLSTAYDQLRLPSGGWLSYDDSGPHFGTAWWSATGESCRPLQQSGNVLLPGLRRAVLGAGSGDKQIQVALDFAEHGVNHGQQSGLAMQIFAFGHLLIDDFPYHKSTLRRYAEMTVGHPTVVIEHQNQHASSTSGDVEFYAPLMDGVSAIRVNDTRAYAGLASKYTRSLVLNAIDPDMPYVVDIFEVAGGTLHDYHLRSTSQHPSTAKESLPMQPMAGLRPLLPPDEIWKEPRFQRDSVGSGYGLLFDVKRADVTCTFSFETSCKVPWDRPQPDISKERPQLMGAWRATPDSWPDRPSIGIQHHVAVGKGYEFFSAESPSLTESTFHGIDGKPADQWPRIPHHILRHRVKDGESSVFVVVHEPYHNAPAIRSVTRLDTDDDMLVALRIEAPGRTDTLVYALDCSRDITVDGISLSGRMALITRQDGKPPRAYLIEGTHLKADGVDLASATADYSGSITAMERCWEGKGLNRLRVTSDPPLPAGDALRGAWMFVQLGSWTGAKDKTTPEPRTFPGAVQAVEIDHVAVEGKAVWVYTTNDPGLSMSGDKVEESYWPARTFSGAARFILPTAATTHPLSLPPPPQLLAIAPAASAPASLKPGVLITYFQGDGHNIGTMTRISEKRLEKIDDKTVGSPKLPGAARLEAYLRVPADGVYTIHFGTESEYRLTLEKKTVIESFRGCALMPETRQVRLSSGLYAVGIECYRQKRAMPLWLTADWEGPGLPRQSFIPALFAQ